MKVKKNIQKVHHYVKIIDAQTKKNDFLIKKFVLKENQNNIEKTSCMSFEAP